MKPRIAITDERFVYTDAANTCLAKTFARERKRLDAEQKARVESNPPKPPANVRTLERKRSA